MFKNDCDSRLSAWSHLRTVLDSSKDPLLDAVLFWNQAPLTTNVVLDPYYQASWPTPWEIIERNKYDDFTKAVMIGYTLLLTEKFKDSNISIQTMVDKEKNRLYNTVCIDDLYFLNFCDTEVISADEIPSSCRIENLVLLERPR